MSFSSLSHLLPRDTPTGFGSVSCVKLSTDMAGNTGRRELKSLQRSAPYAVRNLRNNTSEETMITTRDSSETFYAIIVILC